MHIYKHPGQTMEKSKKSKQLSKIQSKTIKNAFNHHLRKYRIKISSRKSDVFSSKFPQFLSVFPPVIRTIIRTGIILR